MFGCNTTWKIKIDTVLTYAILIQGTCL